MLAFRLGYILSMKPIIMTAMVAPITSAIYARVSLKKT
jgi:hypothetical protein